MAHLNSAAFLIAAAVFFIVAAFPSENRRVQFNSLGFACVVLAYLT